MALERVEETGRWRFIDTTPTQEREAGKELEQATRKEYEQHILPPTHELSQKVSRVAQRIVATAGLGNVIGASSMHPAETGDEPLPDEAGFDNSVWDTPEKQAAAARMTQEWEVVVIEDGAVPNAFVTANGKIFVFTGALAVAGGEDGLAAIIGHEIAHQVMRHPGEKQSATRIYKALDFILNLLGLELGFTNIGVNVFLVLPNSRTMETEADTVGLRLMAKACYDPLVAIKMWDRFSAVGKHGKKSGSGWWRLSAIDLLQTHPTNKKRMKHMEKMMPELLAIRALSGCSMDDGRPLKDAFALFNEMVANVQGEHGETPSI
ncbi:hypothetical protein FRB99_002216 [Tulasnella sp. 403]|nr:hypothetical protein FRB99_002216 [Tulasnella sp. 403]